MENRISSSAKLLSEIFDLSRAESSLGAFLFSFGSARILSQNMRMTNEQFRSSFRGLQKNGYIKKINENQFLITPKSLAKVRVLKIISDDWTKGKWDGWWRIIVFDIPEKTRSQRNIFRSLLKRKGFIGIQGSVFIAPFAEFEELAKLRKDLKIEKYVSFFRSKSAETDDDRLLKKKFKL
ncbi:MAG: CRISPR-associated endonuclease Cas2 [bacterium]